MHSEKYPEKSFRVASLLNGSSPALTEPIEFGGRKYAVAVYGYANPTDVISRLNSLSPSQQQALFVVEYVREKSAAKLKVKNVMPAFDFIRQARKQLNETLSDESDIKVFRSKKGP